MIRFLVCCTTFFISLIVCVEALAHIQYASNCRSLKASMAHVTTLNKSESQILDSFQGEARDTVKSEARLAKQFLRVPYYRKKVDVKYQISFDGKHQYDAIDFDIDGRHYVALFLLYQRKIRKVTYNEKKERIYTIEDYGPPRPRLINVSIVGGRFYLNKSICSNIAAANL